MRFKVSVLAEKFNHASMHCAAVVIFSVHITVCLWCCLVYFSLSICHGWWSTYPVRCFPYTSPYFHAIAILHFLVDHISIPMRLQKKFFSSEIYYWHVLSLIIFQCHCHFPIFWNHMWVPMKHSDLLLTVVFWNVPVFSYCIVFTSIQWPCDCLLSFLYKICTGLLSALFF
jgi:hypothetical protein